MFQKIINFPGFWKSVVILSVGYLVILVLVQWMFTSFASEFFKRFTPFAIIAFLAGGFIVGFLVTYGKFWGKLKQEEYKNK